MIDVQTANGHKSINSVELKTIQILKESLEKGSLKLHNLAVFDKALKIKWLQTVLSIQFIWIVFSKNRDVYEIFVFGIDRMERNRAYI